MKIVMDRDNDNAPNAVGLKDSFEVTVTID